MTNIKRLPNFELLCQVMESCSEAYSAYSACSRCPNVGLCLSWFDRVVSHPLVAYHSDIDDTQLASLVAQFQAISKSTSRRNGTNPALPLLASSSVMEKGEDREERPTSLANKCYIRRNLV